MTKLQKAVIFDIDGVLAIKSPDRGYRDYEKVGLDRPSEELVRLLFHYLQRGDTHILFVTGRKELCRGQTFDWITKHLEAVTGYNRLICGELYMRSDKDHRKGTVLKAEIYETKIKDRYDVMAVFEDDPDICDMYKSKGLTVLEVRGDRGDVVDIYPIQSKL